MKHLSVTRRYIAKKIKKKLNCSLQKATKLVDSIINTMLYALQNKYNVKLRSFGTFINIMRSERVGRNPKTLESAKIPQRTGVKFKASPSLKDKVNRNLDYILYRICG